MSKQNNTTFLISLACLLFVGSCHSGKRNSSNHKDYLNESEADRNQRMEWWREARFGMFIHWGLYAVPAGEWGDKNTYGEWIRTTAQIPLDTYDQFRGKFNPTKYNAKDWVQMAKDAGMKYIVITTKHHDGFALFDSKVSDFDAMATPYGRDLLKDLASECQKQGVKLCFYHSIMDWHHPDYLPRRDWEKNRSEKGAKMDRYVDYMKRQLKELCSNYGEAPHVLWFDGEWESTWNSDRGKDLYNYVRSLKPSIIINNRVGAKRDGMAGFTAPGHFAGDFGTPEQEIPATGLPGVDWESCMTMNDNWGYNKADKNFKTTQQLLHNLADIASKGGNFLLNVGPTAEGLFPQESIERLKEIGAWMGKNGESIHGTQASPIGSFDWGRITMREQGGNTIFYLHVFSPPSNGQIVLNGIGNSPMGASFLAAPMAKGLSIKKQDDAVVVNLPKDLPDKINSVILLQLKGKPIVYLSPVIEASKEIFIDKMEVKLKGEVGNAKIHYTLDGTEPSLKSAVYSEPIILKETTTVSARIFADGLAKTGISQKSFWQKKPLEATSLTGVAQGLQYFFYEGNWEKLPKFDKGTAKRNGVVANFNITPNNSNGERFGFEYYGYIKVPETGIYTFSTASDDGSELLVDGEKIVDNDGLHGMKKVAGYLPLAAGYHQIVVRYFESVGGDGLNVTWSSDKISEDKIPDKVLFHVLGK